VQGAGAGLLQYRYDSIAVYRRCAWRYVVSATECNWAALFIRVISIAVMADRAIEVGLVTVLIQRSPQTYTQTHTRTRAQIDRATADCRRHYQSLCLYVRLAVGHCMITIQICRVPVICRPSGGSRWNSMALNVLQLGSLFDRWLWYCTCAAVKEAKTACRPIYSATLVHRQFVG